MSHVRDFLMTWSLDPLVVVALVVTGGCYARAVLLVTRRHPAQPWPRPRSIAFFCGLLVLGVVLLGPLGAYDEVFFWAHMVQHLALMMVAAPLLLLGAPVLLALRVSPGHLRRTLLVPVLRSRAARIATDPVLTWLLFAAVVVGTHVTPFYDLALRHRWLHVGVEHPLYLGAALLYFYPLVGANPGPHRPAPAFRVLSLFVMMVPETLTGFFLYTAGAVRYPALAHNVRPFGPGPLADQQLGGALMWAGSMAIDAVWIALSTLEWLRFEERKARRVDAEVRRELEGSPV